MPHILIMDSADNSYFEFVSKSRGLARIVTRIDSGAEVLEQLKTGRSPVNFMLLDWHLAEQSGDGFLPAIRQMEHMKDVPIFVLADDSPTESKLRAFSQGADDFLPRSIDPLELAARMMLRMKRTEKEKPGTTLKAGPLVFDFTLTRALATGHDGSSDLNLTRSEFIILAMLAKKSGQLIPRKKLIEAVWGETKISPRTIDVHICGIRRKLGEHAHMLVCRRQAGYRLELP